MAMRMSGDFDSTRDFLILTAYADTYGHGVIKARMLARVMLGSFSLHLPGSGLMFVAPDSTEGQADDWGQVRHLGEHWDLRTMLLPGPY